MVEALVVERYPTDRTTASLAPPKIFDVVGSQGEADPTAQRPPPSSSVNLLQHPAIRRDLLAGRSLRSTIKAHGVGSKTVQRIKAELADQASA